MAQGPTIRRAPLRPLIVRADAGPDIGTGHVMRCIALGQIWKARGGHVIFVSAKNLPLLWTRLKWEGFKRVHLGVQIGSHRDGTLTARIAHRNNASWVAVDGYKFGPPYRKILKENGSQVLWVDDLGSKDSRFADILLNQNIYACPDLYQRTQDSTQCLFGPRFALIRSEFGGIKRGPTIARQGFRLLVSGGGSDPHNLVRAVLVAIKQILSPSLVVEVVVGAGYRHWGSLKEFGPIVGKHRIRLWRNPSNMAKLMGRIDGALVTSGSIVWELMRMGIPSLLVVGSNNQGLLARHLEHEGLAQRIGEITKLNSSKIHDKLSAFLSSKVGRYRMARRGLQLVDGKGAERVFKILIGGGTDSN